MAACEDLWFACALGIANVWLATGDWCMKRRMVFLTVLAILTLGAIGGAHAQPISGFYAGAGLGVRIPLDVKNTLAMPGFHGTADLEQKAGYDSQLSVGYAFGNGWRFEVEGNYGSSNVSGVTNAAFPAMGRGTIRDMGVMANTLFDLDIGSPYVYPYLGAGLGYQSTHLSGVTMLRTDTGASFTASGEKGAPAGQAIVGLSFPVPNMPGLSITADYRIMDVLGGAHFDVAPATGVMKLHNQFTQSGILSIRFAFDTPPPPAR
jgi:hypothetical protein